MNRKTLTVDEALARIEAKRRRRWVVLLLVFSSWILGLHLLKHGGNIMNSLGHKDSYEDAMVELRYGLLYAALGFCFLFFVPNIWIGRLPTREELALLENRILNKTLDRTS